MMIDASMTVKDLVNNLRREAEELHQKLFDTNPDYRAKVEKERLISLIEQHTNIDHVQASNFPQEISQKPSIELNDLSTLSRSQSALEVLLREGRPMSTREITAYLNEHGVDMSGNASVSISNSLARLERQNVVKRQRRNGKSVWVLSDSEKAKEKLGRILQMPRSANGQGNGRLTYGDVAETALRKAEHELHINDIMKAVNAAGLTPTRPTLSSGLIKDRKNRFINKGNNTFILAEWKSKLAQTA